MNIKITKVNDNSNSFLDELAANLEKNAVQPVRTDNSLFHQINTIMNGGVSSKFSTVSEVVEDMKARSGLTAYLAKLSNKDSDGKKVSIAEDVKDNFAECFSKLGNTLNNIITSTKGGLPVPAILDKLKNIHFEDCDINFWEDPRLIEQIAKLNLQEKSKYPNTLQNTNVGKIMPNTETNQWDDDYFYGINA